MKKQIAVKQSEENPIPVEIIANAIVAISEGMKKIRASRLTERALILLITDASPKYGGKGYHAKHVTASDVRAVLDGIDQLEKLYLK